ncbi:Rep family protein [Ligilactobacillus sp. LYQ112]|uniref:Rep family protein n=1 Tax=Ligilactobacillus sp. LYQ112 TaxID=3391060 RepID=UPI003983C002
MKGKKTCKCKKQRESPRSRGWMYVQQLQHLPFDNETALLRRIKTLKQLERYAAIIHDHDTNAEDKPVAPHVHVMLEFKKPRAATAIAKELNDEPQTLQNMLKKNRQRGIENGFCYLIHDTANSRDKYQYNPEKVEANFKYQQYIKQCDEETATQRATQRYAGKGGVKRLAVDFRDGKIDHAAVEQDVIQHHPLQVKDIMERMDALEHVKQHVTAAQWKAEREAQGKPRTVLWLYGDAGVGKSWLARLLAQHNGDGKFFRTGSRRDPFQNYHGEHALIIDDLRPDTLPYEDLLSITDPYNFEITLPARYHDQIALVDLLIITTPYNPPQFYQHQRDVDRHNDSFAQLDRRLTAVVHLEKTEMHLQEMATAEHWELQPKGYNKYIPAKYQNCAVGPNPIATLEKIFKYHKDTVAEDWAVRIFQTLVRKHPRDIRTFNQIFRKDDEEQQKSHQRRPKQADDRDDKDNNSSSSSSHSGKEE